MQDLWLRKSEAQKIVETFESLTKSYSDYLSQVSKEFTGLDFTDTTSDLKSIKRKDNKTKNNFTHSIFDIGNGFKGFNNVIDGFAKNVKTSVFLNCFNYSINLNNLFFEAKKNPFIPTFQVDLMRDLYIDNTTDYVLDFLFKNTVDDFKLKDGSLNDEIIDIILNNITKLTKTSYKAFPELYNEILAKVIPGEFIMSLLTYPDDRTEMEKVIDMLIHLSPTNYPDLKIPLAEDPFLNILSFINPKQKKEKTVVETLGEAIQKFDISGYSKVKAASLIINRASDLYEEQKKLANTFLNTIIDTIPVSEEKVENEILSENEITKSQDKAGKKGANSLPKQKIVDKAKKGVSDKKQNVKTASESGEEESLIAYMAKKIVDGEWVNYEKIEEHIYKILE